MANLMSSELRRMLRASNKLRAVLARHGITSKRLSDAATDFVDIIDALTKVESAISAILSQPTRRTLKKQLNLAYGELFVHIP